MKINRQIIRLQQSQLDTLFKYIDAVDEKIETLHPEIEYKIHSNTKDK